MCFELIRLMDETFDMVIKSKFYVIRLISGLL